MIKQKGFTGYFNSFSHFLKSLISFFELKTSSLWALITQSVVLMPLFYFYLLCLGMCLGLNILNKLI